MKVKLYNPNADKEKEIFISLLEEDNIIKLIAADEHGATAQILAHITEEGIKLLLLNRDFVDVFRIPVDKEECNFKIPVDKAGYIKVSTYGK